MLDDNQQFDQREGEESPPLRTQRTGHGASDTPFEFEFNQKAEMTFNQGSPGFQFRTDRSSLAVSHE
jgi:hypothetical protein